MVPQKQCWCDTLAHNSHALAALRSEHWQRAQEAVENKDADHAGRRALQRTHGITTSVMAAARLLPALYGEAVQFSRPRKQRCGQRRDCPVSVSVHSCTQARTCDTVTATRPKKWHHSTDCEGPATRAVAPLMHHAPQHVGKASCRAPLSMTLCQARPHSRQAVACIATLICISSLP